jgi:RNA 3'-terminal phosphate cyclase (ATP)
VSLHAKTAQWVAGEVLGISWDDDDGGAKGIGFTAGGIRADGEEQAPQALQKGMQSLEI